MEGEAAMSALKIACIDVGATKGIVQVFAYGDLTGITETHEFSITKDPNDFDVDFVNLCIALDKASAQCGGFDAISFGVAGRLKNGMLASAGKLHDWVGKSFVAMLKERYPGVQVLVDNDGAMLTAVEIIFGVLSDPRYYGKSVLVVAPGTGIAVCLALFIDGKYVIRPGEGSHMVVDMSGPIEENDDCCGMRRCVESASSGRTLERFAKQHGTTSDRLDDDTVNSLLVPQLAALVRNTVAQNLDVEVVVMSGGVPHKRPLLTPAIAEATHVELNGVLDVPEFILSTYEIGGLLGCLARWMIAHPQG